jgi:zinc protease
MSTRTVIAVLGLALASPLSASPEKQTPPVPGEPKAFEVPTPKRFALDNGLEVTFVDYGTVPKVRVELSLDVGNAHESASQVWLADVTADMLAEGTQTRTASQISEAAARMGGSLDVSVGGETTELSGDVLSEFGPEMVRLIADVVRHPAFPNAGLERIKADRQRQLSIARSQAQQLALEKFRSVLYGDHAFGRVFPTAEMIGAYDLESVRAFYEAGFGPERSDLYVVGRFDRAAIEKAIRETFGDWEGAKAATLEPPTPKSTRAVHIVDRPGAVQSTIVLGLPVIDPSHPDYLRLAVTNTLLGGFFSSRVTANIREDKGYTYSPYSQISTRSGDAYWAQNADVATEVTGAALKEIFFEIDRLQSEPPSAQELDGVLKYVAGVFVLQNSSRAGIVNRLEYLEGHGLSDDYLRKYVERVYAVSPEDVQAMAREHIRDAQATIVVVGDKKTIESELSPFGQ